MLREGSVLQGKLSASLLMGTLSVVGTRAMQVYTSAQFARARVSDLPLLTPEALPATQYLQSAASKGAPRAGHCHKGPAGGVSGVKHYALQTVKVKKLSGKIYGLRLFKKGSEPWHGIAQVVDQMVDHRTMQLYEQTMDAQGCKMWQVILPDPKSWHSTLQVVDQITMQLYEQTMDAQEGVVYFLLEEMAQQRIKENLLAYALLLIRGMVLLYSLGHPAARPARLQPWYTTCLCSWKKCKCKLPICLLRQGLIPCRAAISWLFILCMQTCRAMAALMGAALKGELDMVYALVPEQWNG